MFGCLWGRRCRLVLIPALITALLLPVRDSAKVIGINRIAQPLTRERIEALSGPEQRLWLQYLARSERQKAADRQRLMAERSASGTSDPDPAPSGPGASSLAIKQPAAWYLSAEALRIARNIITYQLADGGWSKNIDMVVGPRPAGGRYDTDNLNRFSDVGDFDKPSDPGWHYIATLDNDSTYSQIRFLARIATVLWRAGRVREAAPFRMGIRHGVEYLLKAQYPNGGWPQVWPLEGGYHDAITINDDAMLHAIEILEDVAGRAPDYAFLPSDLSRRSAQAAARGIDCLLRLQIIEHGVNTVWAQQYDPITLAPTSARNYEMAALSTSESCAIVEFLMRLAHPSSAEVASVHAAAAWLSRMALYGYRFGSGDHRADRLSPEGRRLVRIRGAGPIWSRYYAIGSDTAIFADRDKTIHDDVNELSRERRNGYSWFNSEAAAVLAEYRVWSETHTSRDGSAAAGPRADPMADPRVALGAKESGV
jgi:PelA/Pel-15E family pectate lyase